MIFQIVVFIAAAIAGGIASITGFGIGSVLTPLLATSVGTRLAVAAISIPHLFATALRFWRLRAHVDKAVLIRFGIPSAAGGLTGALLHNVAANRALDVVFGLLLVFVGISELSGLSRRMRFGNVLGLIAGAVSGVFGGLVGNQGGIRSAALLGFDLDKQAFVATATATGLIVDAARMPAYFVTQGSAISAILTIVVIATLGAVIGTIFGERVLRRVPERLFRSVVAVLILTLGVYMTLFAGTVVADAGATVPR
ncbi:MAG TPA: sulfite exporter TauE/SafE family protein [Gemmatimonadaceae bacterium]|nr:sulfite exporter TauE/SafE family protein [Gemmatimonadaceae bacterium]